MTKSDQFLLHEIFVKREVGFADLSNDDLVLEIGAGPGNLTREIAKRARVIAIESDGKYISELKTVKNAKVIHGNALDVIKNLKFNRKSTLDLLAQALGREEYGLGSTVGSMAEGIHDLRRQITIYTDFLPKHVKWQLEYEVYNLIGDSTFERTFNNETWTINY